MDKNIGSPELYRSDKEKKIRNSFVKHFKKCPIPDEQMLQNLGLFLTSKNLSRILFINHLYQQILDVHGNIIEFGTNWGQVSALFSSLRGIYEPFNRMRKIIGFDTFTGLQGISEYDNKNCPIMKEGEMFCMEGYDKYLEKVMEFQEQDNPMSHIKKFEIIKGDARIELPKYLSKYPETIIALAFFDFDIYKPTFECLKEIRPHLVRGSVLAFDELNDPDSSGETIALNEVFGLNNIELKRFRYTSRVSYFVVK